MDSQSSKFLTYLRSPYVGGPDGPPRVLISSFLTSTCNGGTPLLLLSFPSLFPLLQYMANRMTKIRSPAPPHEIPMIAGFDNTGLGAGASVGGDDGAGSGTLTLDTPLISANTGLLELLSNETYELLALSVSNGTPTKKSGEYVCGSTVMYSSL